MLIKCRFEMFVGLNQKCQGLGLALPDCFLASITAVFSRIVFWLKASLYLAPFPFPFSSRVLGVLSMVSSVLTVARILSPLALRRQFLSP